MDEGGKLQENRVRVEEGDGERGLLERREKAALEGRGTADPR